MESSGQEEYGFLASLAQLVGARRVLEVGTASGCGALALARAMAPQLDSAPAGAAPGDAPEVVTVDMWDGRVAECREYDGPVPIRFIKGESNEVLRELAGAGERFDLVFIDGGHHYEVVSGDWEQAKRLSNTVALHDALQFSGVERVVAGIRRDPEWDVAVLSYPGITRRDEATGVTYFSRRCPGLAVATRRLASASDGLRRPALPERPTARSRRAFSRRVYKLHDWHETAGHAGDMNLFDWRMLFHFLWNAGPSSVVHLGHPGTGATLILLEYARSKKASVTLADPTDSYWNERGPLLPEPLAKVAAKARVLTGDAVDELAPEDGGPVLYWVDEYVEMRAYVVARRLARGMRPGDVMCVRNCSPDEDQPIEGTGFDRVFGALCTCPPALPLLQWLESQPLEDRTVHARLASPQAAFGDYENAGHWLVIWVEDAAPEDDENDDDEGDTGGLEDA